MEQNLEHPEEQVTETLDPVTEPEVIESEVTEHEPLVVVTGDEALEGEEPPVVDPVEEFDEEPEEPHEPIDLTKIIVTYPCYRCGAVGKLKTTVRGRHYCPKCWEGHYRWDPFGKLDVLADLYSGEAKLEDFKADYLKWVAKAWNFYKNDLAISPEEIAAIEAKATELGILPVEEEEPQEDRPVWTPTETE